MRYTHQQKRERGHVAFRPGLCILALLLSAMAPAQVFAASCNTSASLDISGPGGVGQPWFVGEILTATSTIQVDQDGIVGGSYVETPNFGFASDCTMAGASYLNCVSKGREIQFEGNVTTTESCRDSDDNQASFDQPESSKIDFYPDVPKLRVYEPIGGDPTKTGTCSVSWDFQFLSNLEDDNEVISVFSFPIDPLEAYDRE